MSFPFEELKNTIKAYGEPIGNNPNFAPTQENLLNLIDSYSLSKFRDGDRDSLGYKKVFYNIVNFPVEVAAKMLDRDIKDILLLPEDWASKWTTWLSMKEFQMWMKDKYFGRFLNQLAYNWPKYGHLFAKKVKEDVKMVHPKNMIFNPMGGSLENQIIVEKHENSPTEFTRNAKEGQWTNAEEVLNKKGGNIIYYEMFFPENCPSCPDSDNHYLVEPHTQIIIDSWAEDTPIYKNLAWEEVPGRILGRGDVEKLFEEQIYLNRIANYKSEGLHWSSKHLFQTRDKKTEKNLLTETENGEILLIDNRIEPIPMEERNMAEYGHEEERYERNAEKRTFSREPITGGRAPAGTPLGSTELQVAMASGYFKQKQDDLSNFIKEIIWDWVLPQFKNQNRKEHRLLIENLIQEDDQASEKFMNLLVNRRLGQRKAELLQRGRLLSENESKVLKGVIAERIRNEEFKIPKNLYENLKYKIEVVVSGESLDVGSRMNTLTTLFQTLGSNPAILRDPRVRRILEKMVSLAGINPKDLNLEKEQISSITEATQEVAPRGGSIAAPTPRMPAMVPTPTRT